MILDSRDAASSAGVSDDAASAVVRHRGDTGAVQGLDSEWSQLVARRKMVEYNRVPQAVVHPNRDHRDLFLTEERHTFRRDVGGRADGPQLGLART
jgi:hypothetical protein